jgi:glucan 1,3-beta-glucosidase
MRTPTLLLALAATTTTVLASNSTTASLGFALGTKKPDGTCKFQPDYEADFAALSAQTPSRIVRGYAASDCNNAEYILPAAKAKGFQVILGVWPDVDSSYEADKAALVTWGSLSAEALLGRINEVKAALPGVKVGFADSWNKIADGTADPLLSGGVSLILANAFAFWQGSNVGAGAEYTYFDDIQQALGHVQTLTGSLDGFEFWNGETGWPTDGGSDYKAAKAGTSNAVAFYKNAVCAMLEWGVNVFYFEAFDEPQVPPFFFTFPVATGRSLVGVREGFELTFWV